MTRAVLLLIAIPLQPLEASVIMLHGKVVMADGALPAKPVMIERVCSDIRDPIREAVTNQKGEYFWRADVDPFASMTGYSMMLGFGSRLTLCELRAKLSGYYSTAIDLSTWRWSSDPNLPTMVLTPRNSDPGAEVFNIDGAPRGAIKAWDRAGKAAQAKNWAEAERQLRAAVQAAPKFAQGWNALGLILQNAQKTEEAREAYRKAIEYNPKLLAPFVLLARLDIDAKDWKSANRISDTLIAADTKRRYPEAYIDKAIASFHLKDLDGAEASAHEAVRLDKKSQLPRAEYVLGLILEAKHEYASAGEHMRKYLDLEPKAADADAVRSRIANLGKPQAVEITAELDAANVELAPSGEAWVPGGMKALAAIAHSRRTPSYQNFFLDFCRAFVDETSPKDGEGYPQYIQSLQSFIASVAELAHFGDRRSESTMVTISLASEAQRANAERILTLLGWKIVSKGGATSIEPGDRPQDSLHQQIPALLGIDEISMQETLEAGRSFQFEIPTENARLIGGEAWSELFKILPSSGGIADAFTRDARFARTYAGLGAMGPDTAAALVSSVGLRTLMLRYSTLLAAYGEAFTVSNGQVVTPGAAEAQAVWRKLAGANPHDPKAFFRALLEKDQGRLAAFYFAVWKSDAAHQQFYTKTESRAERFYAWYRDLPEFHFRLGTETGSWQSALMRNLPLDKAGAIRFPGGRPAWSAGSGSDEEVLLTLRGIEALVPVARLEERREASLDQRSAALLAQRYSEWRALFPYFEKLSGLGSAEFEALAAFGDAVSGYAPEKRNAVLGEWHSLVELIVRGGRSGSLDARQSAQAFRLVCDGLKTPDHSTKALEALREITGNATADLDDAVPNRLLRLSGDRRTAFDRVKELQSVPRIGDPAKMVAALSGTVYAASLDPEGLLVNEDPHLLSKHQFNPDPKHLALFSASELIPSSDAPGSHLQGGFVNFEEVARTLAHGGKRRDRTVAAAATVSDTAAGPATVEAASIPADAVFRADGRLVEVYATITDQRGRYIDDLPRDQFQVIEQGKPQALVAFESRFSEISLALLLDTTGSMQGALPALKNAALKLIGELRPADSIAVYSFNDRVSELQPFTTDKDAAKRAVLRTYAFGRTALYDALARVNRDLAGRSGKKVIVVFTDGDDNASTVTTEAAIHRAKAAGVPVYTIAQGEALIHPPFLKQLADVSKATGGVSFAIQNPGEIRSVFEHVSEDLMHGYMFAFRPAPGEDHAWRSIEVVLRSAKGHKVRAREGYYPE